jgi:hypothetical protein
MLITHTRKPTNNSRTILVSWAEMPTGGVGDAIPFSQYTDKSVQVVGIFGTGVVTIEGSNDGENWSTLTDPQGNDLNIATAKIELVCEATLLVRPRVVSGDGTTNLSVTLLARE